MAEKLMPLKIPQGIFRNGTTYQSMGRWFDANLVRFADDVVVKPIGGWRRAPDDSGGQMAALTGIPRGALAWTDDSGGVRLAIGTTSKLYVITGGVRHDITPADLVVGRADTIVPGNGAGSAAAGASSYGYGFYGSGAYGVGSTLGARLEADSWQLDKAPNGSHVLCVLSSDGRLLEWDGDPSHLAAAVANAPTTLRGVVVTPEQFVVVLGAFGNARTLAWASRETTGVWDALPTNSAGDFDVISEGVLMCGARTRKETLIWTDCDLQTMTYIGGDLIYRIEQAGDKCGIISKRAFGVFDTKAVWMGRKSFFIYDGFTRALPSDVHDYVFSDMNETQVAKIWAKTVAEHGEVWFHYCSANSSEIDRYVIYNYREGHWSIGQMARTAGVDKGAAPYPIMCKPTGEIYEHEYGTDYEGVQPRVECGPLQIGDGDNVVVVNSLVPDERTLGDVQTTFFVRYEPMGEETVEGPFTLSAVTDIRFSARLVRVRHVGVRAVDWRVGVMSLGVIVAGRR